MEDVREQHQQAHKSSHVPQEYPVQSTMLSSKQIINIVQPSSTDLATNLTRSLGSCAQCRSVEWQLFIDNGPYLTKYRNPAKYRTAKCKKYDVSVRYKRQTLQTHIINFCSIPDEAREQYRESTAIWKGVLLTTVKTESSQASLYRHFSRKMTENKLEQLEDQAVRFVLRANLSFIVLENEEIRC